MASTSARGVTRFYHGGVVGLEAGQALLPADETDSVTPSSLIGDDYDRSRVYLTPDVTVARLYATLMTTSVPAPGGGYALQQARGSVYEVEPVGALLPDPDYPFCWSAERGVVTAVIETEIPPNPFASPTRGREPGRNDPCPCRSGAKYKKCCASAWQAGPTFVDQVR